jgi:guanylate kinase
MISASIIRRLMFSSSIIGGDYNSKSICYKVIIKNEFHLTANGCNRSEVSSQMGSVLNNKHLKVAFVILRNNSSMVSAADESIRSLKPVVICGPSGVGKSTIIEKLMSEVPSVFGFSVSHTTRKPRYGEVDGVNYHFITRDEFMLGKQRGEFIECAEFSGNMYATSKMAIKDIQDKGQVCILDLEMKGVKQIKETKEIDPRYVFIQPPSIDDLERRLKGRKTETEESLEKRLNVAKSDLEYVSSSSVFDIVIVNDDVDKATKELKEFILEDVNE